MPRGKLALFGSQAEGLEPLSGAQQRLLNFLVQTPGTLVLRPGIRAYQTSSETGEIIGAVTDPIRQAVVYVTADRYIHAMTSSDTRFELSTSTSTTQLDGTERPVFAVTSVGVMIAGGGAVQKVTSLSAPSSRLGGSPPVATHIAAISSRLVVNKADDYGAGLFMWSGDAVGTVGTGYYETWVTGTNYAEAELRPDPVVAVHENGGELFVFGVSTLQVYTFGTSTVLPIQVVNAFDHGCSAAHSPIRVVNDFAWINEKKQIVVGGRSEPKVISAPWVSARLSDPNFTVSDCWGFRSQIGTFDLLVWQFPTEQTALCFDRTSSVWCELRGYNTTTGQYSALNIGAYVQAYGTGAHLIGTNGSGMCEWTLDEYDDLGTNIVAETIGGHQDFGTRTWKGAMNEEYVMQRGGSAFGATAAAGTLAQFETSHRDDLGEWTPWQIHSMGAAPDYKAVVRVPGGGTFQQRQSRLRYSSGQRFSLADAQLEYEELDS